MYPFKAVRFVARLSGPDVTQIEGVLLDDGVFATNHFGKWAVYDNDQFFHETRAGALAWIKARLTDHIAKAPVEAAERVAGYESLLARLEKE